MLIRLVATGSGASQIAKMVIDGELRVMQSHISNGGISLLMESFGVPERIWVKLRSIPDCVINSKVLHHEERVDYARVGDDGKLTLLQKDVLWSDSTPKIVSEILGLPIVSRGKFIFKDFPIKINKNIKDIKFVACRKESTGEIRFISPEMDTMQECKKFLETTNHVDDEDIIFTMVQYFENQSSVWEA